MKRVVFAINPENDYLIPFRKLRHSNLLVDAEVHLVHIFPTSTHYMDMVPFVFPAENQRQEIVTSIKKILNGLKVDILAGTHELTLAEVECLFDSNPKEKMCDYLKGINADLVITSTKKMGAIERLFHSSFTEYMLKFAPCELLVLRDH